MKVTFVQTANLLADTQLFGAHFMPVWAYTLAAHLRVVSAVEISLFDERLNDPQKISSADVFLFTGINQDYNAIAHLRNAIRGRFPEALLVIGGPITWFYQRAGRIDALAGFDYIVIGDGEEIIGDLIHAIRFGNPLSKIIEASRRFDLSNALPMDRELLDQTVTRYAGAALEVSRGLPDANNSSAKRPFLIVRELDHLFNVGANRCLLACDNFIADPAWAEVVCDEIIQWTEQSGKNLSLYTSLALRSGRAPRLLRKLRRAGIDVLYIEVESFRRMPAVEVIAAIRSIQSFGFVVVAGFTVENAAVTLESIVECGLLSAEPSIENRSDFTAFIDRFNQGKYEYQRLLSFYECLNSGNFVATENAGYADLNTLFMMFFRKPKYIALFCRRVFKLVQSPVRTYYVLKAAIVTARRNCAEKPLWFYFKTWLFTWSNSLLKYSRLGNADFDLAVVKEGVEEKRKKAG